MASWLKKKMIEQYWIVLTGPNLAKMLLESTKMMLRGTTTEIRMIEFVLASILLSSS
jgi:hypothetical protein